MHELAVENLSNLSLADVNDNSVTRWVDTNLSTCVSRSDVPPKSLHEAPAQLDRSDRQRTDQDTRI